MSSLQFKQVPPLGMKFFTYKVIVVSLGLLILAHQMDSTMCFISPTPISKIVMNDMNASVNLNVNNHHYNRKKNVRSNINNNHKFSFLLFAKKNKNKNSQGKGFGKQPKAVDGSKQTTPTVTPTTSATSTTLESSSQQQQQQQKQQQSYLTSVDDGSSAIPTLSTSSSSSSSSTNANLEDRTGTILREKYGLRTREEQEAAELKRKQAEEQRLKIDRWNKSADDGEDFDLLQVVPDPVLIFVDRFLKLGVTVSIVLFVLAGLAITVEAGSKATNNPLPVDVDNFITNVVEPNFTPGLIVLLSFSVALGLFASLQLNSASSTYREDK